MGVMAADTMLMVDTGDMDTGLGLAGVTQATAHGAAAGGGGGSRSHGFSGWRFCGS